MSAISNMRTTTPVNTFIGAGSSQMAGTLIEKMGLNKAFVVCDGGVKAAGLVDGILNSLHAKNIETSLFDRAVADAPDVVIDEAAEACSEFGAEVIVAIGGGSSLDTAKGISILKDGSEKIADYCLDRSRARKKHKKLILIPTTSGTGSEVTNGCVVAVTSREMKVGLNGPEFLADYALLDPMLTLNLPKRQTSATAMDAFAHCVEAMLSGISNPMCDLLSLEGIKLICQNLGVVMEDGHNMEARQNMMYAAYLGGISLGDGGCSFGHAIAHTFGARYHLPHGVLCAVALPMAVEYYAHVFPEKIRKIAGAMGLEVPADADEDQTAAAVADAMRDMNKKFGIPVLSELGIAYEDLPELAKMTLNEACTFVVKMSRPGHEVTEADYLIPLQKEYLRK